MARGNLVHGGHARVSPAALNAKAKDIYHALADAAPVREAGELPPADTFLVARLARVLVRLDYFTAWVDEHGPVDKRGNVTSPARWEHKLTNQAVALMEKLGMSPTSRAKLGVDLARVADLATAMSEPDPAKRRALLLQTGLDLDGGA